MVRVERHCWQSNRLGGLWVGIIIVGLVGSAAFVPFAGAAGQSVTAAGESALEDASRPIVFQMQWCPQAQFAGPMMAREKGFFREEGLANVEIQWATAGDRPFDRLAEGKSDFCMGWLADAIVEKEGGLPLVHLAQVIQQSSLMLVAWHRSGIDSPQDLTGKRVGLWGGQFRCARNGVFPQIRGSPDRRAAEYERGAIPARSRGCRLRDALQRVQQTDRSRHLGGGIAQLPICRSRLGIARGRHLLHRAHAQRAPRGLRRLGAGMSSGLGVCTGQRGGSVGRGAADLPGCQRADQSQSSALDAAFDRRGHGWPRPRGTGIVGFAFRGRL